MSDDIDIEEYINNPIIPIKFLIKNGFYIKKNNEKYPLLRLDLSSIVLDVESVKSKFALKNVDVQSVVKDPVIIKKT